MNKLKNLFSQLSLKKFWKDESAQGMTEYILLIVVVVSLAYIFRKNIQGAVSGKASNLSSEIQGFEIEK